MRLSIIIIFFNMRREAARTLYSLSHKYQRGVSMDDYEVIAIDNASTQPLSATEITAFGENFTYYFHPTDSVSPVRAINFGADLAHGEALAVIVDGARMASPGLVRQSLNAWSLAKEPFICARAWHLGPDVQKFSIQRGYNQAVEDALLNKIDWMSNGYRLFEISTIAPSSRGGFLGPFPSECSWFVISRSTFLSMGGFDSRFEAPGGGLCNHEFRDRAVSWSGIQPILLLGEGLFHQVHGGVATNAHPDRHPLKEFALEYEALYGKRHRSEPVPDPLYYGSMSDSARLHIH